jgi:hypothetical protein
LVGVLQKKNKKYQILFEEVKKITNTYDLMGLARVGAPDDEYNFEISKIVPLIGKSLNVDELAIGIVNVYNKMFDANFLPSDELILKMATDIFKLK